MSSVRQPFAFGPSAPQMDLSAPTTFGTLTLAAAPPPQPAARAPGDAPDGGHAPEKLSEGPLVRELAL